MSDQYFNVVQVPGSPLNLEMKYISARATAAENLCDIGFFCAHQLRLLADQLEDEEILGMVREDGFVPLMSPDLDFIGLITLLESGEYVFVPGVLVKKNATPKSFFACMSAVQRAKEEFEGTLDDHS